MKNVVLKELLNKWQDDAMTPEAKNGSPESEISNAKLEGTRNGMNSCARDLEQLINLLPD